MACGTKAPRTVETGTVEVATRSEESGDVRVGDADRQRTADLLAEAAGSGHLDLEQLDARLATVWAAGTRSELAAAEAGLPASLRAARVRREAAERARAAAQAGLSGHLARYLSVMALLVAIWLVVGLGGGSWYPWPLWPALGWGIAVLGQVRTARAPVV